MLNDLTWWHTRACYQSMHWHNILWQEHHMDFVLCFMCDVGCCCQCCECMPDARCHMPSSANTMQRRIVWHDVCHVCVLWSTSWLITCTTCCRKARQRSLGETGWSVQSNASPWSPSDLLYSHFPGRCHLFAPSTRSTRNPGGLGGEAFHMGTLLLVAGSTATLQTWTENTSWIFKHTVRDLSRRHG